LIKILPKKKWNNLKQKPLIKHCCFDLDGTLVDSNKTIYEATAYSLEKLGIDFNINQDAFALKIGQHFVDIFDAFSIDVPDFEKFITIYKMNYFEQMEYSKMYEGVEETLSALKDKDIKVSLLTTKVQDQADRIIDHFNIREYFDLVMGRREGIAHKPSPEPLLKICDDLSIDVKSTLMVGDTELDIQCGKNAGSYTCGVLYGYRTKELLEIEKPDFIVGNIKEILELV
jgi:HAD superfamily hydrolase (TIGR01549 family)